MDDGDDAGDYRATGQDDDDQDWIDEPAGPDGSGGARAASAADWEHYVASVAGRDAHGELADGVSDRARSIPCAGGGTHRCLVEGGSVVCSQCGLVVSEHPFSQWATTAAAKRIHGKPVADSSAGHTGGAVGHAGYLGRYVARVPKSAPYNRVYYYAQKFRPHRGSATPLPPAVVRRLKRFKRCQPDRARTCTTKGRVQGVLRELHIRNCTARWPLVMQLLSGETIALPRVAQDGSLQTILEKMGGQFMRMREQLHRRNFPDISTTLNRIVVGLGYMTAETAARVYPTLSSPKLADVEVCLRVLFEMEGVPYIPFGQEATGPTRIWHGLRWRQRTLPQCVMRMKSPST